jgi:tRNA(fMet)-specific endonuclease VapC
MEKNRVILDTSAYSAFLRGDNRVASLLKLADEIIVNPIILGELLSGFAAGRREKRKRAFLQDFLSSERVRVVEVDEETAERYAVIVTYLRKKGTPVPTNDLWIASTAMQHGLKVLTTDRHYLKIPHILAEYCEPD